LAPAAVSGAAALWGAGAKGATFLNAVGLDSRVVAVVDVNPRKWGQYVPGTGHRVVAPEELKNHRIDTVVITNGSYRREISERLVELGISADVICV
jgi:FlaA1/EpsC-like NDP-sugar epimerase